MNFPGKEHRIGKPPPFFAPPGLWGKAGAKSLRRLGEQENGKSLTARQRKEAGLHARRAARRVPSPQPRSAMASFAASLWAGVMWERTAVMAAVSTAMSSVKPMPATMSGTASIGRTK